MFSDAPTPSGDTLLQGSSRVHLFQRVPDNPHPRDDYFRPATDDAKEDHRLESALFYLF